MKLIKFKFKLITQKKYKIVKRKKKRIKKKGDCILYLSISVCESFYFLIIKTLKIVQLFRIKIIIIKNKMHFASQLLKAMLQ